MNGYGGRPKSDAEFVRELHARCQTPISGSRESVASPRRERCKGEHKESGYDTLQKAEKSCQKFSIDEEIQRSADPDSIRKLTRVRDKIDEFVEFVNDHLYELETADKMLTCLEKMDSSHVPLDIREPFMYTVIFGNIRPLKDFAKNVLLKEFVGNIENLDKLMKNAKNYKDRMISLYSQYIINIPKSEFIVKKYSDFFQQVLFKTQERPMFLEDPYIFISKLPFMFLELVNTCKKANLDNPAECYRRVMNIMEDVNKIVMGTSDAGRMQNFPGQIESQGTLLYTVPVFCEIKEAGCCRSTQILVKSTAFLFYQSIIVAQVIETEGGVQQANSAQPPRYEFRYRFPINKITIKNSTRQKTLEILGEGTTTGDKEVDKLVLVFISEEEATVMRKKLQLALNILNDFNDNVNAPK